MTPEECKRKGITCGIWQGRFQCIHNGHYYVYNSTLQEFDEQMIAIVNPNPDVPADPKFIRFGTSTNPLNYFQRMLLWKEIINHDDRKVSVFPCWHARKSVKLEREFLPTHTKQNPKRCWILPLYQDDNEIQKAKDLESLNEVVCDANWADESLVNRATSASYIRHLLEINDKDFISSVPSSIAGLTKKLFDGVDPYAYRIVVQIGDRIDYCSLQKAINWVKEETNRYVVIAIVVSVSSKEEDWWFEKAQPIGNLTFYQKMKELEMIFNNLSFNKFLITPVFLQNNSFVGLWEYSSAFLPSSDASKWIVNQDCVYNYGFKELNIDCEFINNSNSLLSDEYYSAFAKRERIKPLDTNIIIDDRAKKLISEINSFIKVHIHSNSTAERSLVAEFNNTPNEIKELIRQLRYNHITPEEYEEKLNVIYSRWINK